MTKKIIAGIKWLKFWDRDGNNILNFSSDIWPNVIPVVYTLFVGVVIALHWKLEKIPTDTTITWMVIGSLGAQAIEALKYIQVGGSTINPQDEHKPPHL